MNIETTKDFEIIGCEGTNKNVISRPTITYWQDAWRRLKMNKVAITAVVVLILLLILVIIGPTMRNYDYISISAANKNIPPGSKYWFGTDNLGRDLFSRTWLGARVSMTVAIVCTAIQIIIGSIYGGTMAYLGGRTNEIMMRIIEFLTSMPSLLVTILIMLVLGNNMFALLIAMSVTSWCGTARQMRGLILQLKTSEYVLAARALGASPKRIITRHLIPNTLGILILITASSIPSYIFTEAGLSFLGMGLQPPDISLGILISIGQQSMDFYPYHLFYPALILCITVLAFNLLGDGLRDALDPRMRQ